MRTLRALRHFYAQLRLWWVSELIGWAFDALPKEAETIEVLEAFGALSRAVGAVRVERP